MSYQQPGAPPARMIPWAGAGSGQERERERGRDRERDRQRTRRSRDRDRDRDRRHHHRRDRSRDRDDHRDSRRHERSRGHESASGSGSRDRSRRSRSRDRRDRHTSHAGSRTPSSSSSTLTPSMNRHPGEHSPRHHNKVDASDRSSISSTPRLGRSLSNTSSGDHDRSARKGREDTTPLRRSTAATIAPTNGPEFDKLPVAERLLRLEKEGMRIDYGVAMSRINLQLTRANLASIEQTIHDIEQGTEEVCSNPAANARAAFRLAAC